MKTVTVSAPGKLMLLGEHAVVYGRPCVVTAVGQRMRATVELIDEPVFILDAADVGVSGYRKSMNELGVGDILKGARFAEHAVKNFHATYPLKSGVHITTSSEFSSLFGFGSSSASAVCVTAALDQILDTKLTPRSLFESAYKTVLDVQGKGSGFDIASAILGGTISYARAGELLEPLDAEGLSLVVGYTGVKADTVTIVNEVLEQSKKDPARIESIYDGMGTLATEAASAIGKKDWKKLGLLMNEDQELLEQIGVSSEILDRMITAARKAGAMGAKLSGAGRGDCMIALVNESDRKTVVAAINVAGGTVIDVPCNVPGVRVEF